MKISKLFYKYCYVVILTYKYGYKNLIDLVVF